MSQILLVRHGQASLGLRDYDRLSPNGVTQGQLLGAALTRRQVRPTVVISGGAQRHTQTIESAVATSGWIPEVVEDARWAEFDHMDVIAAHRPAYRNIGLMKADLIRTFQPRKAFHEMYAAAIARWTSGRYDGDYAETFPAFTRRVDAAFAWVRERAEGEAVVVVTSSGPMSWVATSLLFGGIETWNRLNTVTVNTGVSWLSAGPHDWRIDTVNEFSHLDGAGPGLITLR